MDGVKAAVGHHQQHVPCPAMARDIFSDGRRVGNRQRPPSTANAVNFADQVLDRQALVFRHSLGLIDAGNNGLIGQCQRRGEFIFENIAFAGIAARLEDRPEPAAGVSTAHRVDGFAHRGRMMGEVVDYGYTALFAAHFLAPFDPFESAKAVEQFRAAMPMVRPIA